MSLDANELCYVIGSFHQGMMTEVWLVEKSLVDARDEAGLEAVDSSRILGLPAKLVRTPPGTRGMTAFMGNGEEARKALDAAGITEAPIAWNIEKSSLVYVTKESEVDTRIAPRSRVLHAIETVQVNGSQMTKVTLYHRFPGEADWAATMDSLPDTVSCSIESLDDNGVFYTLHPQKLVSEWLVKSRVALDIA